jgi:chromate transporter
MSEKDVPSAHSRPPPTARELYLSFAQIALSGFGGVMAWSRRVLVNEKRWLSPAEFNELYALCQIVPGPNVVNLAVMYGARVAGVRGAVVAVLGLISLPVTLMLVVGALYNQYGAQPGMRGLLAGLAAAAAGLIVATSIQVAESLFRARPKPAHAVAGAAFIAVGVLHLPLVWVLALLIPISIGLAWIDSDAR